RVTASREEFARRHGLDPARPIIALLPGSRAKEIHYHLPAMIDAAHRLRAAPEAHSVAAEPAESGAARPPSGVAPNARPQFILPLASTIDRAGVAPMIDEAEADFTIIEGDTYNALGHAAIAVVASGTATVESALLGVPMVIVYRGSLINWLLIRPLIH